MLPSAVANSAQRMAALPLRSFIPSSARNADPRAGSSQVSGNTDIFSRNKNYLAIADGPQKIPPFSFSGGHGT
jgi:hypothetical protein